MTRLLTACLLVNGWRFVTYFFSFSTHVAQLWRHSFLHMRTISVIKCYLESLFNIKDYSLNLFQFYHFCNCTDNINLWWNSCDKLFLAPITNLSVFMIFSCGIYHSTSLLMLPLRIWSFWSSFEISFPVGFRLRLLTRLLFHLHSFFHPYLNLCSLARAYIYLHLFLSLFLLSPPLTSLVWPKYIFMSNISPLPTTTPPRLYDRVHRTECLMGVLVCHIALKRLPVADSALWGVPVGEMRHLR